MLSPAPSRRPRTRPPVEVGAAELAPAAGRGAEDLAAQRERRAQLRPREPGAEVHLPVLISERPIKYTSDISAHHSRSVPLDTLLI